MGGSNVGVFIVATGLDGDGPLGLMKMEFIYGLRLMDWA